MADPIILDPPAAAGAWRCPVCGVALRPAPSDRPGYTCRRCPRCDRPQYRIERGGQTVT